VNSEAIGSVPSEFRELFDRTISHDETFSESSQHTTESHLLLHKLQQIDHLTDEEVQQQSPLHYRLRHKCVDFLVQTGLSGIVQQIIRNSTDVLTEFDAIDDCSIVKLPIYHFGNKGEIVEPTPLFTQFEALLGSKNMDSVIEIQLGLICLQFSRSFPNNELASVLFSECSLKLNYEHPLIPRSELLFIVQPFTHRFYRFVCRCKDPTFCCSLLKERLIATENLAAVICRTVFQYVALHQQDVLFAKDKERAIFLKGLETVPITLLTLVRGYSLNPLQG
jgi:hypothetical protein